MSIARCPFCEKTYDQDFDVEHEERCALEHPSEFFTTNWENIHRGAGGEEQKHLDEAIEGAGYDLGKKSEWWRI